MSQTPWNPFSGGGEMFGGTDPVSMTSTLSVFCFEMIDSPFTGISDFGVLPKFLEILLPEPAAMIIALILNQLIALVNRFLILTGSISTLEDFSLLLETWISNNVGPVFLFIFPSLKPS